MSHIITRLVDRVSHLLGSMLSRNFDFAFTIAKMALKSKLPELHIKYALHLEDEVISPPPQHDIISLCVSRVSLKGQRLSL